MKTKVKLLSVVALFAMLSSCNGNAELEKRVANLERRLNILENNNVIRNRVEQLTKATESVPTLATQNSTPAATPTTPTVTETPASVTAPGYSSNASFKWESMEYNFGAIKQGDIVKHTFKFTNNGTENIQIQSTSASCGCTVPNHTTTPIPPGGSGKIEVQFNSKGKSGQQNPVVTVVANTKPQQTKLNLRGLVQVDTETSN